MCILELQIEQAGLGLEQQQLARYFCTPSGTGDKLLTCIHIYHQVQIRRTPLNNITSGHDIAVLELAKAVTFSTTVWPICLPASTDKPLQREDNLVEAFGFGVREINDNERIYAEVVNKASLQITNQNECR